MASTSSRSNPSTRGNGRGRGRGRGGSTSTPRPKENKSKLPPHRKIDSGLLPSPIQVLSLPTHETGTTASIDNTEYIGSYNWIDANSPTIIIPGSPPGWTGRETPFRLRPDQGVCFKDQNGFRMPSSVLLPLMKAVDAVGKEIDWPVVDFVTDRNNLRKLLRWASGSTGRSNDFRIDFELAGENTVLFNRFEERTKVMADGKGYGFSFEHETTSPTPGCERSTAHHRIVKYDFFGLKMIVRFEVDAFLPSDEAIQSSRKSATTLDSLTDSLSTLQVTTDSASPPGLQIIRAGSEVPHRSVIELKTSSKKHIKWSDIFPQLYLSQTPWFYVGFHEKGTFTEVQKSNMLEMKEQRKDLEGRMRQLGQILEMIQELAIAHGTKKCLSLVCQSGVLTVYERVSKKSCLPAEVLARFDAD